MQTLDHRATTPTKSDPGRGMSGSLFAGHKKYKFSDTLENSRIPLHHPLTSTLTPETGGENLRWMPYAYSPGGRLPHADPIRPYSDPIMSHSGHFREYRKIREIQKIRNI